MCSEPPHGLTGGSACLGAMWGGGRSIFTASSPTAASRCSLCPVLISRCRCCAVRLRSPTRLRRCVRKLPHPSPALFQQVAIHQRSLVRPLHQPTQQPAGEFLRCPSSPFFRHANTLFFDRNIQLADPNLSFLFLFFRRGFKKKMDEFDIAFDL